MPKKPPVVTIAVPQMIGGRGRAPPPPRPPPPPLPPSSRRDMRWAILNSRLANSSSPDGWTGAPLPSLPPFPSLPLDSGAMLPPRYFLNSLRMGPTHSTAPPPPQPFIPLSRVLEITSICEHGRQRSQCKECGGASICEHGRRRSQCKECGGASICEHGRRRSRCKEEVCRSRLQACREQAAACLHVRPPSLQHRACKRQRDIDDDSDEEEGMQIAMARSRADQQGARQQAPTGVSRLVASSSEAGPSSEAGSSLETGRGASSEAALSLEAGPSSPSQPGVEAEQTCPICMDGCDGEPRGRPDPQEPMRGWGYTSCCGSSFHFDCLSTWLLDTDLVGSTNGPVPLPSNCPHCRSNRLAPTSSRMLQDTKR